MFNLKTSLFGQKAEDKRQNTALPNSFGKVRTLKEDLDNLEKGKKEVEEEMEIAAPTLAPTPSFSQNQPLPINAPNANTAMPASKPLPVAPMTQAATFPKPVFAPPPFAENNHPKESERKEASPFPDSLGSSSYFEKSPFEEIKPGEDKNPAAAPVKHESKNLVMVLSIIIAIAVLAGGFYYYWFVIKKSSPETSQETAQKVPVSDTASPVQKVQESDNKNLRHLNVDLAGGSESLRSGIDRLASEFIGSSPSGDLIEVNVLDKNNQAIKVKDFIASLGITFTETTSNRFLDNYTLFIKNDNAEARLGAVFELSGIEGLTEEFVQQEKSLPIKFKAFYLKQAPLETETPFSSSQYSGADIRFLNFPSPPNTSFDYAIIKGKQANYLIISTSQNTTRSILDYMEGK
jgi:hypothetical protein